jgi:Ca-activated chloride channel family protein
MPTRLFAFCAFILSLQGCRFGAARTAEPQPNPVTVEASLDGKALAAEKTSKAIVRLVLRPRADDPSKRVPANVALVVDTSGSMAGKPLEDARAAALTLVRSLDDSDKLSLVVFGSQAELLQPTAVLDRETRATVERKLTELQARGTTDLAAGLRTGIEQVESALSPEGINRLVLLGDGVPNDSSAVQGLVERARSRGISITSLGIGLDYDEALMGQIARGSGGKFHHVEDSAKVAGFLRDEVLRLQGTLAKNGVLELTTGPGVSVMGIVGQPWQQTNTGAHLDLGDLSRGEVRTVYVELSVKARRPDTTLELIDAKLSFTDLAGASGSVATFVSSRSVSSEAAVKEGRDPSIELGAAFARSAETTVRAVELARRGQHAAAKALLENTAELLDDLAARSKNSRLIEEAKGLRALVGDLPPANPDLSATAPKANKVPTPSAIADTRSAEQARRALRQYDHAVQRLQ